MLFWNSSLKGLLLPQKFVEFQNAQNRSFIPIANGPPLIWGACRALSRALGGNQEAIGEDRRGNRREADDKVARNP
jgi:hypothetical protein